ncbi:acetyl-coenzyme A synthetase N-terminal domain-containing protein [Mycobacteroides abscessus]
MTETSIEPDSYPPSPEFVATANATADLYQAAEEDRLGFWEQQAGRLHWDEPFGRFSTGPTRPSRSGLWAASSTSRTTASTGM